MNTRRTAPRGRPPTITRVRLADAAIAMGLPKVSVVGVAAELGVTAKALYQHISGLDELKRLTAEQIFLRWPLPAVPVAETRRLEKYMLDFGDCMWALVEQHAGIAPYLLRRELLTPAMSEKMTAHQEALAAAFGLSLAQASWLVTTVAYYCVAVADTLLPFPSESTARAASQARPTAKADAEYRCGVQHWYARGTRALIVGVLSTLDQAATDEPQAHRLVGDGPPP